MTNPDNDTGIADLPQKKAAADGPVIESRPVDPGSAETATRPGAEIRPADSSLLGEAEADPLPAAAKRTAGAGAPPDLIHPAEPAEPAPELDQPGPDSVEPPHLVADTYQTPADAAPGSRVPPSGHPAEAPRETAPLPAPAPVVVQRRGGFWPMVFGGIVAAGLGAAAAIWALPHLPPAWLPAQPAPQPGEPAPGLTADDVRSEIRIALAELPAAESPAAFDSSALEARIDGVVAEARQAAEASAQQAIAALPAAAPAVAPEELAALTQQVEAQAAKVAELESRPVVDPAMLDRMQTLADQANALQAQIAAAAQQAQTTITDAQAEAERMQQATADATRRAEALAAVAALQTALEQGVSTDAAAQQLRDAGVEPPAAVTAGAPTLVELQEGYDAAARAALRVALRESASDQGAVGVVGNFLRAQTGARSVTPREGSDPDAILSRAGAAVAAGDIKTALAEIAPLPEPARAAQPMAEWLAGAQAYDAAHDALSELSGASN